MLSSADPLVALDSITLVLPKLALILRVLAVAHVVVPAEGRVVFESLCCVKRFPFLLGSHTDGLEICIPI